MHSSYGMTITSYQYIEFWHVQGPNYVWHTDGLDKLKPYGFAVHGCIDGYVNIQD